MRGKRRDWRHIWGRETLAGPRPSSWAPPHSRGARGRRRQSSTCTRCRPASTSTVPARAPRRGPRRPARRGAEGSAEPRQPEERLPDDSNASASRSSSSGDASAVVYFGKLLYNKGVHVCSLRSDVDRAGRHVSSASATKAGVGVARAARTCSPARSSIAIRAPAAARDATVVPSILPEAVRNGRRRGRGRGCRRSSRVTRARGDGRPPPPPPVSRPSTRPDVYSNRSRALRRRDSLELATKLAELLALPPAQHAALQGRRAPRRTRSTGVGRRRSRNDC
jgi:hypothetical protein